MYISICFILALLFAHLFLTDKSKRLSIPKPKPVQQKDVLPSIKLKPTIHSRTFGNSLEGFHLRQDVHDLQNCRYLRFKGTSLPKTLVNSDDEDISDLGQDQIKVTSWGHTETSGHKRATKGKLGNT